MKVNFLSLTTSLALLHSPLGATPSLRLPHEWAAPLESGSSLVLVDSDTGQTRLIKFDGNFAGDDSGPIRTNLPEVTGLNTGLQEGGD